MPFTITPEGSDHVYYVHALIDTGCELNLIKRGLLPLRYFRSPKTSIRLVTANGSQLGGGTKQTVQNLRTIGQSPLEVVNLEFQTFFLKPKLHVMQFCRSNGCHNLIWKSYVEDMVYN